MEIRDIRMLPVDMVDPNRGQVEGLPANPRDWTQTELERLAASLSETPELFAARPILAVEHGGRYVTLGGNMRLAAASYNGEAEVPAIVFPATTPPETLRQIVIKDNGSFGRWDYDMLANEWDDLPLPEWGVPAWDTEAKDVPETDMTMKDPKDSQWKECPKCGFRWRE